jgi:hypothetical protein
VAPKSVTIGTPFRYTLHITADKDIELIVPSRRTDRRLRGHRLRRRAAARGEGPGRPDRWFTLVTA